MKLIKFWFPLVLYSVIIFCVSSLPNLRPPNTDILGVDKILHIGEYIPFGFLTARVLYSLNEPRPTRNILWLAACAACLYGITDEYHQSFVEGRSSDMFDVAADTIGGVLGAALYRKMKLRNSPD